MRIGGLCVGGIEFADITDSRLGAISSHEVGPSTERTLCSFWTSTP